VGFTQLWGEAWLDMINGGAIDPTTGQDINPGGTAAYGADKGLGAGDVLRFGNADLYFGSTQLSSVGGNLNISQSSDDSFSGGSQVGDVCLFDAQHINPIGGSAGNLILAIDGNGDGTLGADDIMFDVEDDISGVTYDGANDVFVFA